MARAGRKCHVIRRVSSCVRREVQHLKRRNKKKKHWPPSLSSVCPFISQSGGSWLGCSSSPLSHLCLLFSGLSMSLKTAICNIKLIWHKVLSCVFITPCGEVYMELSLVHEYSLLIHYIFSYMCQHILTGNFIRNVFVMIPILHHTNSITIHNFHVHGQKRSKSRKTL